MLPCPLHLPFQLTEIPTTTRSTDDADWRCTLCSLFDQDQPRRSGSFPNKVGCDIVSILHLFVCVSAGSWWHTRMRFFRCPRLPQLHNAPCPAHDMQRLQRRG
ncbi:hypothetical protein CDEST_06430 [Colletotrichum destructivum]|uniref:Uncharacterized protein n=1 Tax=Colletotrichum destructivum TaxID=34406 RepID=A0AAX4IEG6_9PEZI|nr:hypothetical protein CDEST_06430 [Colletotrichum destructivum]